MNNQDFKEMLNKAIEGDKEATEKIIIQYMPLINRHCFIKGTIDEDMRQVVIMHILKKISKFKVY